MDGDLISGYFDKLDEKLKIYAIKILDSLFENKNQGLNVNQINSIFNFSHKHSTNEAIQELKTLGYIFHDKDKSYGHEKRYFINKAGEKELFRFYNR